MLQLKGFRLYMPNEDVPNKGDFEALQVQNSIYESFIENDIKEMAQAKKDMVQRQKTDSNIQRLYILFLVVMVLYILWKQGYFKF